MLQLVSHVRWDPCARDPSRMFAAGGDLYDMIATCLSGWVQFDLDVTHKAALSAKIIV